MEALEKSSGCLVSVIYYEKGLQNYYKRQEYDKGDDLEIALKNL